MGLRHSSQDATHICREDTFPAARFSPPHCEGRHNRAVHSATIEAKIGRQVIAGASSLHAKTFSVDRIGCEDYRIIGENRDACFAKSFFAGKFGVSIFRSNE
jgi:hypothetical protein